MNDDDDDLETIEPDRWAWICEQAGVRRGSPYDVQDPDDAFARFSAETTATHRAEIAIYQAIYGTDWYEAHRARLLDDLGDARDADDA